jgi:predicted flap endonuclease-1-like 5' DNA nuclease
MSRRSWTLITLALLPVVGLLALVLWWWLRSAQARKASIPVSGVATPASIRLHPTADVKPAPPPPDDLQRIAGIGPKISSVLQETGIHTFAQLAITDARELKQILQEAGVRAADPTTWPEQAALAAEGRWEALKALQGELVGGRRV